MRIQDKYNQLNFDKLDSAKLNKKENKESSAAAPSGTDSDSVTISGRAKEFNSIKSDLKSAPEVREQLVQDLKERINAGTYDVSGKKVAEKMVNLAVNDLF